MKSKTAAVIIYIASAVCYGVTVITLIISNYSFAIIAGCEGSLLLCLGSIILRRSQEVDNQKSKQSQKQGKAKDYRIGSDDNSELTDDYKTENVTVLDKDVDTK